MKRALHSALALAMTASVLALSASAPATAQSFTAFSLKLSPDAISENGGTASVTATLNQALAQDVSVEVSVAPVAPATAADFKLSGNTTLTIEAGDEESTGAVTITAVDNSVFAANRAVTVSGRSVTPGAGVNDPAAVRLHILEDDYVNDCAGTAAVGAGASAGLVADCEALLDSRDDLAGDASLNWSTGRAIGNWTGVGVTGGRVSYVWIDGAELSGSVPAKLGNLSKLEYLSLANNELSGSIPAALGDLWSLKGLQLNGNTLSGSVPAELGSLSSLDALNLSDNKLSGLLPAALTRLSRLSVLNLRGNELSGEVTLAVSPAQISEDGGEQTVTVTATLDAGTAWANRHASTDRGRRAVSKVTVSVAGSGASDAVDFEPVEPFEIRIPQGQTSAEQTFALTPTNDTDIETDETVTVTATGTGARWVADTVLSAAAPAPTLTITDDDAPRASLVLSPARIGENGGAATVTAVLDSAAAADTEITVSAAAVSPAAAADFNLSTNRKLTIAAGGTASTGTVTITAVDNSVSAADKTVTVSGSTAAAGVNGPVDVTLTIVEDDHSCEGSTAVGAGASQDLVKDCEALLAAKDLLIGGGTASLNWSTDLAIGSWDGVTVSGGRATALRLREQRLAGTIPAGLGSLSSLTALDLGANRLSGAIPAQLGSLSSLTALNLSSNGLSGAIPAELGNLSSLTGLWLYNNELSGAIPAALGSLSNLTALDLNSNGLSGSIPAELGNLSSLTGLWLNKNELSGAIPAALGGLSNLKILHLRDNELSGLIPAELAGMSSLTTLRLFGNDLSGELTLAMSPAHVDEDGGLQTVVVTATLDAGTAWANGFDTPRGGPTQSQVTVSVAGDAGDFAPVGSPGIITIPKGESSAWGTFRINPTDNTDDQTDKTVTVTATGTGAMDVAHVALSTAAPGATLIIADDELPRVNLVLAPATIGEDGGAAAVTAALSKPTSADVTVTVSAAAVSPAAAGDFSLSADKTLTIAAGEQGSTGTVTITAIDNSVSADDKTVTVSGATTAAGVHGPFDVTLTIVEDDYSCEDSTAVGAGASAGLVADCEALLAAKNVLIGGSTASLNWSTDLAIGSWDGVTVSGGRVTELRLREQRLSGGIPAELGNLSSLTRLDLSINGLSGPIPAALGNLTGLTGLWLNDNELSGAIPAELGNLSSAVVLNLRYNELSGSIPAELAGMSSLLRLRLFGNDLSSEVTLTVSPAQISEDGGRQTVTVTATLDAGTAWANGFDTPANQATSSPVTVSVAGSGVQGAVDFAPVPTFIITIPKGDSSASGTFALTPTDDDDKETDETVTVTASGGGADGVANVALSSAAPAPTVTIADDDSSPSLQKIAPATVDEVAVTSAVASGQSAYKIGDAIEVTVTFTGEIAVVGSPQLGIDVGGTEKAAPCARKGDTGDDAKKLVCSYTVADGDTDGDGISVAEDKLSLPAGASIKNAADADATLDHDALAADADHKVDGVRPQVWGVYVEGLGALSLGDAVEFTASFSEDVTVSGSPSLGFRIGSAARSAPYDSSNSSGQYVAFSYTLTQAADGSVNGESVSVPRDSVSVPSGASIVDAAGNAAVSLTHAGRDAWHVVVDLVAPPKLTGVRAEAGLDQVTLSWDDPNDSSIAIMEYRSKTSGEYGPWIDFGGTAAVSDHSAVVTGLEHGTAYTFQVRAVDAFGANAGPASDAVTATTTAVDTTGPAVTGLTVSSAVPPGQTAYGRQAVVELAVTFDEAIVVTGSPQLGIDVGGTERAASCARKGDTGGDANTLVCSYKVTRHDAGDDDGISVAEDKLSLPAGASIGDSWGNDATLRHDALAAQPGHKVDTTRPWVAELAVSSSVPAGQSAYKVGDVIEVTVTFNEAIAVTGSPRLKITVGAADKRASCARKGDTGDDARKLVCSYTVAAGDADGDGISVSRDARLLLSGSASITDRAAGNRTWRFLRDGLADQADHKVDGTT